MATALSRPTLKLKGIPTWEEAQRLNAIMVRFYYRTQNFKHLRNACFIGFLSHTGVRISEALSLKVKDLDLKTGIVIIRQEKKKSERLREVVIPEKLRSVLELYIKEASLKPDDNLFGIKRIMGYKIVKFYTEKILERPIHPHAFRHAYAIRVLEKTKDVDLCRRLLGHSSYNVTMVYLDYTIRDRKEEVERIFE